MRAYECVYFVRPDMEEEALKALIARFNSIITDANGEIEKISEWGKRRLAYEVQDYREGYYVLVQFKSEPDVAKELERLFKISDDVMRYLVTRMEEVS